MGKEAEEVSDIIERAFQASKPKPEGDYFSSYNRPDIFDLVKMDIEARNRKGWEIHGKRLMPGDEDRDWLVEAYEESLDKVIYLKLEIEKRKKLLGAGR